MNLDSALMLTELSLPEDIQAQRYCCGIERIDVSVKFEDVCCPLAPGLAYEIIGILLEDAVVAVSVGFCQITSCNMLA